MGADTPILIMSGNGVDHALLSLAAQYVGIPTVPVAEQYSLVTAAHGRLKQAVEMVNPTMAYVADAAQYDSALRLDFFEGVELVSSNPGTVPSTPFGDLLAGASSVDVAAAHAQVTPEDHRQNFDDFGLDVSPEGRFDHP